MVLRAIFYISSAINRNIAIFFLTRHHNIAILINQIECNMPKTDVLLYQEDDGRCPLSDWLDGLPPKAQDKCIVRIELLADNGHELRRPFADYLRDKIYELRAALNRIQYRMLYFFYKNQCIIVS